MKSLCLKTGVASGYARIVLLSGLLWLSGAEGRAQENAPPPEGGESLAGVQSTASPVIQFWHPKRMTFARTGVPQRWVNLLGKVSDPNGIQSLSYSLNGDLSKPLSIGPDTRRLVAPGDFNIDIAFSSLRALPDSNIVVVTAKNTLNVQTRDSVIVRYQSGTVWPRVHSTAWTSSATLYDSVQVVDGLWNVVSGGLRISSAGVGYDRLVAIGDTTWKNYEVVAPITIHSYDPAGYGAINGQPAVGFFVGWSGHTDDPVSGWQPKTGYKPYGCGGLYLFYATGAQLSIWDNVRDYSGKTIPYGVPYYFKMRVESAGPGTRYSLKVWEVGASEPPSFDLTWLGPSTDPQQGSVMLLAHWVDATFGAVTVRSITSDYLPPMLSGYTTIPGKNSAEIRWQTDELARGRIEYGLTTAYGTEAARADLLTDHSFVINGLAQNTIYHYRVIGIDEAGNRAISADRAFSTTGSGSLVRDEFDIQPIDSALWTIQNPLGDATVAVSSGNLSISLPQNVEHSVTGSGNTMPRVLQASSDSDFEVETKLVGAISQPVQGAGIHVVDDAANYIRFEISTDGSSTRAFGGVVSANVPSTRFDVVIGPNGTTPVYMRVKRERNSWTLIYSLDGSLWLPAGDFTHTLVVRSVGLAARNQGSTPPAYTASFEYFRGNLPPVPRLVSPANAATNLNTTVGLVWTNSEGAQGYHVQLSTNPAFSNGLLVNDSTITETTRTVSGLNAYTQYFWRVRSWNSEGRGPFSLSRYFSTFLPIPNQVSLLAPANFSSARPESVLCVWSKNRQPGTKYWFEISDDSLFAYPDMDSSLVDTLKILFGLETEKTYFWRVRAGNPTGWGPFSQMRRFHVSLTDVALRDELPREVRLEQNYPNPFNPATVLEYGLPVQGAVRLEVFNTLGQRVALLVDAEVNAGYHRVEFTAEGLASGIYFYRLSVNNNAHVLVKRMMVVR